MKRIFALMIFIAILGQSWADEPKYHAMTVEKVQELLNKNIGKYTVSQQTVIVKGEEQTEYTVSCNTESGELMFYEAQLSYCLNKHLAKVNEIEVDNGSEPQRQTITLSRDLSWSQFDFGRDQKVRDLQKEAVINRANDQKRDVVIGGLATSFGDMKSEVDAANSTNNWQNGALGLFFLCLGAITIFVRTKLRHRGSSSKAYGYGYQQESKPDVSQVKKIVAEDVDKRFNTLRNDMNNVLRKFEKNAQDVIDLRVDKVHEALRLEFAPLPVPASIHLDEPSSPSDIPTWENKVGIEHELEDQKVEATFASAFPMVPASVPDPSHWEQVPLPDDDPKEIVIEPEAETPSAATEIMPGETVDEDVEPEAEVERKNDPTKNFNDEDQALYESLVESFPVEMCSSLSALPTSMSNNCHGSKKEVF